MKKLEHKRVKKVQNKVQTPEKDTVISAQEC